jgi:hypothetical protein
MVSADKTRFHYGLPFSTRAKSHQENSGILVSLKTLEYVSSFLERYRSVYTKEGYVFSFQHGTSYIERLLPRRKNNAGEWRH